MVCPQNGTGVLKGLRLLPILSSRHISSPPEQKAVSLDSDAWVSSYAQCSAPSASIRAARPQLQPLVSAFARSSARTINTIFPNRRKTTAVSIYGIRSRKCDRAKIRSSKQEPRRKQPEKKHTLFFLFLFRFIYFFCTLIFSLLRAERVCRACRVQYDGHGIALNTLL